MTPAERELLLGLRAGRRSAYRELFDRHHAPMIRLAERLLRHREDAEDAVQESFVRVHRAVGSFRGDCALGTWVHRIVVNTCLEAERRRSRRPVPEPGPQADERDPTEERDGRRALEHAIAELPPQQRATFVLAAIEELPLTEVAGVLEVAPGTARFHLSEARRRLRERLAPWFRDAGAPTSRWEVRT